MDHPACIYRVPGQMRNVKPDAYTPRMVLIGPLHRPVKLKPGHKKNEYTKMDEKKVKYLESFTERVGEDIVKEIEETIRKEEANIRASYAEPLEWISPEDLVDLVLKDSIFIMEFSIKLQESRGSSGDPIVDNEIHTANVIGDLIMLENQLPYFIFDKSFGPYLMEFLGYETPGQLFLELFSLHTKIKTNTNFNHFTDMFRCVYEESLDQSPKLMIGPAIEEMESAQNLSRVGVDFKAFHLLNSTKLDGINRLFFRNQEPLDSISIRKEEADNYSLHMEFNKGCLVMSSFRTDDTSDKVLRNVIAYEQCHANVEKFTSNYIHFLNFLITKDKDVELLKKEGVLTNGGGRPRLTVDMVNKLKIGLIESKTSQYHSIAVNLRAHYTSRRKRCWATLNKVYFKDLWTGTATMAAILLLFFTLVGSAASVIQAYTSFN
ncbi:putative UPF0481 protein At3g02645 [Eutrema salsugineum]|uniref:putative UPF0481 protein At3g02645 n=1 Tax=Eutrema salsugineum TaxID=72664 RepID=UPI000CED4107|nr:putative UPF0481 protein At3g02645 [Eutrema salsugineum]